MVLFSLSSVAQLTYRTIIEVTNNLNYCNRAVLKLFCLFKVCIFHTLSSKDLFESSTLVGTPSVDHRGVYVHNILDVF